MFGHANTRKHVYEHCCSLEWAQFGHLNETLFQDTETEIQKQKNVAVTEDKDLVEWQ